MLSEYTVALVTAENLNGVELAIKWMDSKQEKISASGWAAYAAIISNRDDELLALKQIETLVERAKTKSIQHRIT